MEPGGVSRVSWRWVDLGWLVGSMAGGGDLGIRGHPLAPPLGHSQSQSPAPGPSPCGG